METSPPMRENCRMFIQSINWLEKIISSGLNSLRPSWKGKDGHLNDDALAEDDPTFKDEEDYMIMVWLWNISHVMW